LRNVVPVDYQEFSWKYINQIIEALADHSSNCFFEKDVVFALMKWAKVCVRVIGLAHETQDICPVEISLYKVILTHQDCCHLFR
jgi:hypoxanthine phosphoribosyltransferase